MTSTRVHRTADAGKRAQMSRWKVGDIVSVKWPEPHNGVALQGTWEGRVIAEDGDHITVHFEYPPWEEAGTIKTESEDIRIAISKGLGFDEKYGEKVIVGRPERVRQRR